MEVFRESRGIAAQFDGPVDDLRRLLAFHGLRSGLPQYVVGFARKLEGSKPFRTDLTALLRSTRDLDRGRLTSDQMLAIVAVAVGGDEALAGPDASPETAHALSLLRMLLAGIGGWSDTGDRAAAEAGRGTAAAVEREAPAAVPKFAARQAEPAGDAAVDVRAFVRSDDRAEVRPEIPVEALPEARPEVRAEARGEARPDVPHLRREPLSEVVRTPAPAPEAAARVTAPTWGAPAAAALGRAAAAAVPETQGRAEGQTRPEANARVDTQVRPTPIAEPKAKPWVAPGRSVSDVPSANIRNSGAAISEASAAENSDVTPTDDADISEVPRRRPISRKLALDTLLGAAAVALLIFGVFEGVRSRHAVSPAVPAAGQAPATTASTAAPPVAPSVPSPVAPPVAAPEQKSGLADQPAVVAPGETPAPVPVVTAQGSTPPSAPRAAGQDPLPRHREVADDGTGAPAAVARPKAEPATPPALARSADLQTVPRGPVSVPEATMDRQLVATHKPVYPAVALAQNVNGTVVLRAFVSTDGTVRRTDVVAGPPLLVNSALAAASWRRYRPFLVHGRPVEVQTEITYHYVTP